MPPAIPHTAHNIDDLMQKNISIILLLFFLSAVFGLGFGCGYGSGRSRTAMEMTEALHRAHSGSLGRDRQLVLEQFQRDLARGKYRSYWSDGARASYLEVALGMEDESISGRGIS